VEPEIVPNGDHDVYACAEATERVLAATFKARLIFSSDLSLVATHL
jgi:hypothetical protein